ncbi:sensor histidine kinase [Pseudoalteromonas sp. SSDWG2]|uniref:sensor histidine kinase n=1 Tax=Pseudoalteromonas sp. SSDWG2 TaxID=3139391 RepID=UPI003BA96BED
MKDTSYHKFLSFKYFEYIIGLCLSLFVAAMVFVILAFISKSEQQHGLEQNFKLVRLSQELRLSSDQLTMMARANAATANPKYKRFFEQILSIRSGQSPRPMHLNRVYWDMLMVDGGKAPFPNGQPQSLLSLLEENGASKEELEALTQAYDQSQSLVLLENQAFNLVEQGKNLEALAILYNEEYLQSKVRIMTYINEFLLLREQKLADFIAHSSMKLTLYYLGALICFLALLCVLIFFYNARSRIRRNIITFLNSEVKAQTDELVSKNTALNEAVYDLKQAQVKLLHAEKSSTLMRLIPGLAHEINTPVGIAVTASSSQLVALAEVKDKVSNNTLAKTALLESIENIESCATLVENSANRISSIINKLKLITQDGFKNNAQVLRLKEEICACLDEADTLGKTVNISLDIDEGISVHAPAFLLRQPIIELIENVYQHTFGTHFMDKAIDAQLTIEARQNQSEITINVIDNGEGIDDALVHNMFDAFVVGNRHAKGLGLGLSVALTIVNQYFCGSLSYSPSPQGGACFAITMPIDGFEQALKAN